MDSLTQVLQSFATDATAGAAPNAADTSRLLPLVYDELRRLAAEKLSRERPGHTLQATALFHEAYLRVAGADRGAGHWNGRTHFFAAAAEAMRRILIDNARRRSAARRGGGRPGADSPTALDSIAAPPAALDSIAAPPAAGPDAPEPDDLLALDAALARLESEDKARADLVKLHYFVGLSLDEAADALNISRATAYRHWAYARAWLRHELRGRNS